MVAANLVTARHHIPHRVAHRGRRPGRYRRWRPHDAQTLEFIELLWSKHEVNLPRRSIVREHAIQHKQNSLLSRIIRQALPLAGDYREARPRTRRLGCGLFKKT